MRIYLIGFMGTGKTTLGYQVAAELDVPFLDTDQVIEETNRMSISAIFSGMGEDKFRKMEAEVLRETASYDKALIATGGGLPVYHHNMQWLNENGITMYLQWPEEILIAGLVHHRSMRPLLSQLSHDEAVRKAVSLLAERRPVYEQASMTLEMEGDFEKDARLLKKACEYIW